MNNSNIWTIVLASIFFVVTIYIFALYETEEYLRDSIAPVDTALLGTTTTESDPVMYVDAIEECPALSSREVESLTVHDLRADDITYILAIGDSITAGFGAKGQRDWGKKEQIKLDNKEQKKQYRKDQEILCKLEEEKEQQKKFLQNNNNYDDDDDYDESLQPMDPRNLYENRGLSFAIGGDENATTLARFLNYYSKDGLIGASTGDHLAHLCHGIFCLPYQYRPSQDQLNGAQTGAMAENLYRQIDYLLLRLEFEKSRKGSRFVNKQFKLLNFFIGNNDLCQSCNNKNTSPENFDKNIRETLDKILIKMPNTVVNLMEVFNVSQVYDVTRGQKYCRWYDVPYINFECACAFIEGEIGARNRRKMDYIASEYNKILQKIVADYAKIKRNDFAIVHNRFDLNLTTFPIDGLSDIDCFHPSEKTHAFISKVLWNNLATPCKERESVISWDDNIKIRCFGENDRIVTY